jgi:hypothetical protein
MNDKKIKKLLSNAKRAQPSEDVWLRIKSKIEEEQPQLATTGVSLGDIIRNFIYGLRPAIVTLCLFFMLGVGFLANQSFSSKEPYLSYVMSGDSPTTDAVSDGIEKYFL